MAAVRGIKEVVTDLLMRLENEGIGGVVVQFAKKPDVVVIRDVTGDWEVVFRRCGLTVKIVLDSNYNVIDVRVRY